MTTADPTVREALWSGRFSGEVHELFQRFNDSLPFDRRLLPQDVVGSRAWAAALGAAGVLDPEDVERIDAALEDILASVEADPTLIEDAVDEDVHSFVERELVERVGDLGKRLHTGRSRNDQVATDLRLWTLAAIDARIAELQASIDALVRLAERERDTAFPGYTHLQRAQPILFAHWCLAYVEMLRRDVSRLMDARTRTAVCPLGAAALSGTAWPVDREQLAVDLGFDSAAPNSLDAVSDRDFVIESLAAIATCSMHLSRLAEDLVFYASGEAGLVVLPDGLCSGSSIMPQKKNPDALELIRGKCGMQLGRLVGVLTTMKALPLAYNKDMQEDKVPLFEAMDELSICLQVLAPLLDGITLDRTRAIEAATGDFANATELADHLARAGVPFREAHHQVGRLVAEAIELRSTLEDLPLETFRRHAPSASTEVHVDLTIDAALARRARPAGRRRTRSPVAWPGWAVPDRHRPSTPRRSRSGRRRWRIFRASLDWSTTGRRRARTSPGPPTRSSTRSGSSPWPPTRGRSSAAARSGCTPRRSGRSGRSAWNPVSREAGSEAGWSSTWPAWRGTFASSVCSS